MEQIDEGKYNDDYNDNQNMKRKIKEFQILQHSGLEKKLCSRTVARVNKSYHSIKIL